MQNDVRKLQLKGKLLRYVEIYRKQERGKRNCPKVMDIVAHNVERKITTFRRRKDSVTIGVGQTVKLTNRA